MAVEDSGNSNEQVNDPIQGKFRVNRKFLENLALIPSNKSICNHPLITAFIDIHYSAFDKISQESQGCIGHLALMLILLEFVSATSVEGDFLYTHSTNCG